MAIHRRQLHNPAIRDALLKTNVGQTLLVEAKIEAKEIGRRIRQLKELVHSTFVADVPGGFQKRFDIYQRAKPHVQELGRLGGSAYDEAVLKVKFAWTCRQAFHEAVKAIAD